MKALLKIGLAILATQMICGVVQAQTVLPMHVQGDGRIFIDVTMNGKKVSALLDTGANEAVVSKKVGLVNVQFQTASTLDFHGDSTRVMQGYVRICLTEDKCVTEDAVETSGASENLVPVTVLEKLGSKVEFDFKAKTLTIE